jgi:hypothetical protein
MLASLVSQLAGESAGSTHEACTQSVTEEFTGTLYTFELKAATVAPVETCPADKTVTLSGCDVTLGLADYNHPRDGDAVVSINGNPVCNTSAAIALLESAQSPVIQVQIKRPNQAQILRTFFVCTNGPMWTKTAGWEGDGPRHGVFTDESGAVIKLDLPKNNLQGELPASLGGLSSLEWLRIFSNHIRGTIPPSLGQLEKVKRFYLRDNELHGTLPASLGNMKAMVDFGVNENQLTGSIDTSRARALAASEAGTFRENPAFGPNSVLGFVPRAFLLICLFHRHTSQVRSLTAYFA